MPAVIVRTLVIHQLSRKRLKALYDDLNQDKVAFGTTVDDLTHTLLIMPAHQANSLSDWFKSSADTPHQIIGIGKKSLPADMPFQDQGMPITLDPTSPCLAQQIVRLIAMHQAYIRSTTSEQNSLLNTRLQHFEILQDAIIHTVAHEFRTPILQVKSGLVFLGETLREHHIEHSTFAIVQEATMRLEALIEHLTMLGTSISYRPDAQIVKDLVAHALRNITRSWRTRQEAHRIQTDIAAGLPPVLADRTGIVTILQLLLDNALRFSQSVVTLSVTHHEGKMTFTITDHGIGIDSTQLERVFERFYQIDSSSTRRYDGLGVGLTVVKIILDYHATALDIKSNPGVGTVVQFSLPSASV